MISSRSKSIAVTIKMSSNLKICESWYHWTKCGNIEGLHLLLDAYHSKSWSEASIFLTVLLFQGSEPILVGNPFKSQVYIECALSILKQFEESIKAAEQFGHVDEMDEAILLFYLGLFYKEGLGVVRDESTAVSYFQLSALKKYPQAMNTIIGYKRLGTFGFDKNVKEVFQEWKNLADDYEYVPAIFNVGKCYEKGIGVAESTDMAKVYYEKAADKGLPNALMYFLTPEEAGKDLTKVLRYLRKLIEQGIDTAIMIMVDIFEYKMNGNKFLSYPKLGLERGRMIELLAPVCTSNDSTWKIQLIDMLQKVVDQQCESFSPDVTAFRRRKSYRTVAIAAYKLALYYTQGSLVERNENKAYELTLIALDSIQNKGEYKVTDAAFVTKLEFTIGVALLNGHGVSQDIKRGLSLIEKAADARDFDAIYYFGDCIHYGKFGVPQSYLKAQKIFARAGLQHPASAYMAGMYQHEQLVPEKDLLIRHSKMECIKYAASQNYPPALYMMGIFCQTGSEVDIPQSTERAVQYFLEAAVLQDTDAMYNAGVAYLYGDGIEKDLQKAKEWFEKAAEQGDTDAKYNLEMLLTSQEYEEYLLSQDAANQRYH